MFMFRPLLMLHFNYDYLSFCRGKTDNLYCLYLHIPHNLIDPHYCIGMLLRGQEKTRQVNQRDSCRNIKQID